MAIKKRKLVVDPSGLGLIVPEVDSSNRSDDYIPSGPSPAGTGSVHSGSTPSWDPSSIHPHVDNPDPYTPPSEDPDPYNPSTGGYGDDIDPFAPSNGSSDSYPEDKGNGAAIWRFFQSLLSGGNSMDALIELLGGNRWANEEWAKFFDYALQHGLIADQRYYDRQLTLDQRKYDYSLLQDQRQYNDPTNQLNRLTAAGIGRDAAIGILSGAGSSGSSGVSGGSPVVSSTSSLPGWTGTPGNQRIDIANTVINGVQALGSLVESGVNTAIAVEQLKGARAANFWSQQQIESYNSVNDLSRALLNLQANGVISNEQFAGFSNADDVYKWMSNNSNNDYIAPLIANGAFQKTFGTSIGRSMFNQYWKSIRDSRDAGTIADEYLQGLRLDNSLKSCNVDKIGAEMALIGSQQSEIEQRIIESTHRVAQIDAEIYVKNLEGDWIQVQTNRYNDVIDSEIALREAQVDLLSEQTIGQSIQNEMLSQEFDLNSAGFPMLKETYIMQCKDEFDRWSTLTGDAKLDRQVSWLADAKNARIAAYLEQCRLNAVGGFASSCPNLWALIQAFNYSGASNLVSSTTDVVGTGFNAYGTYKAANRVRKAVGAAASVGL